MAKELSIEPEILKFTHLQELQLVTTIEEVDRHSILYPIGSASIVTMDEIGCVFDGYRFTSRAFAQLCNIVCLGLHKLLNDYSGVNRSVEDNRENYSFEEAIEFYNKVIKRRFRDLLCGYSMLCNGKAKTIDSVLSSNYKWLSNLELYHRSQSAMSTLKLKPEFLNASLCGRWLAVRYVESKPYFDVGNKDNFYRGYYFSNDETGQASVRAAIMLYRKLSKTSSLSFSKVHKRVRHSGDSFVDRLDSMIQGVLDKFRPESYYLACISRLVSTDLGLGNKDPTVETKVSDKLASTLVKHSDIQSSLAKKIIANLIYQSSYALSQPDVVGFSPEQRDAFDLYNALGREAKNVSINLQENIEQFAYSLLSETFSISQ